jgi:hypothetical protein
MSRGESWKTRFFNLLQGRRSTQKNEDVFRNLLVFAACLAASLLLLWRAETFVDAAGCGLMLDRVMCIHLAVMIGMVGLMHGLDLLDA